MRLTRVPPEECLPAHQSENGRAGCATGAHGLSSSFGLSVGMSIAQSTTPFLPFGKSLHVRNGCAAASQDQQQLEVRNRSAVPFQKRQYCVALRGVRVRIDRKVARKACVAFCVLQAPLVAFAACVPPEAFLGLLVPRLPAQGSLVLARRILILQRSSNPLTESSQGWTVFGDRSSLACH
jgi:hypothetical protein